MVEGSINRVTCEEMIKSIRKMNPGKAAGLLKVIIR